MDNVTASNDFSDLLRALNDADAEYLVVGAHALAFYGYVRASGDFDIWVRPTVDNAARVYRALTTFGAPLDKLKLEELASDDLVFQIGVAPIRIDVITSISGVSFDEAWSSRQSASYMGIPTFVIGYNDLIENKRASGRPKDLLDVEELTRLRDPRRTT